MTARVDAFAPPTATFPLHDVTDVFASRRDRPNPTVLVNRLPRQTVFQIARPGIAFGPSPLLRRQVPNNGGARRDRTDDLMLAKHALSQLSYGPKGSEPAGGASRVVVGLGRLERPTSPLSGVRSNHLSYRPRAIETCRIGPRPKTVRRSRYLVRKRNEDGVRPAKWVLTEPLYPMTFDG